jgi:VWFA-related protein
MTLDRKRRPAHLTAHLVRDYTPVVESQLINTLLASALVLLAAQQAPPPKPGFKSGITLVEVDVVATDKSGRPVRGLSSTDFTIAEDGTPVEIATFSAVDLPAAPPPSGIPPPDRSGSGYASNDRAGDGRVILIALDDVQVSFTAGRMATVKSVARRAVERLGPDDLAAVMTTSGRVGGQVDFTTDKSRLIGAIERFRPQGEHDLPEIAGELSSAASLPGGQVAHRRTISAMYGLRAAARALATIPHRRKGVLLISQGFPATIEDILRKPLIGAAYEAIREFMLTAQRHNVAVYTADPCGLESDAGCTKESRHSLRSIAEATGGFAVTNTNAPETVVERMLAESGTHYLIGYYSPAPPNDGKHHRITVRTRVADVELRAREGYDSPGRAVKTPAVTALDLLARSVVPTPGLPMRVVAIPAPLGKEPSAAVIVGIELPTAVAIGARRIEFAVVAIDHEGKTRGRVRFTTDFGAAEKTSSAWSRTGTRIDLAPGDYQLRVAAAGADKGQGSVFVDVSVPRFDAGLGVGGLSLGGASSIAATAADRLRDVLALIPLATNELAPGTARSAQLPIRIGAKAASSPLTITTTLVRPDGTALALDRTEAAGREYAGASGKVYRVALPDALPSGRYRVVVETTLGRTAVSREVAFTVLARP